MADIDLTQKEWYINRELSQLEFNRRVLAQAQDKTIPLLERLRFLFICGANLDEFFEIRVAGLKQQEVFDALHAGPDGLTPAQSLQAVSELTHPLVDDLYTTLNKDLMPALRKAGIYVREQQHWDEKQAAWVRRYFLSDILPLLSPVALDIAHPFPRLANKSLNFIVSLEGKDAFGRDSGLAVVNAPRSLPRVVRIPDDSTDDVVHDTGDNFVLLTSIVQAHVGDLFPGMQVKGCYQFRVTRDSDLLLDEEIVDDLALALEKELSSRRFGLAVRLEIAADCPQDICDFLLHKHELNEKELYRVSGPVNLSRYTKVLELVERPELCYPIFIPAVPTQLHKKKDLFAAIREGDVLLHHPYQTFSVVVDFIRQATIDPNVLAIKQTIYRSGAESEMIVALIDAALAGKEVTAVIELRARFDEADNIELANRLQEAGVLVVYGVMGYKIHSKMTLVVRREGRALRHYVHMGTGNYHARTAKQYTDYGLLTYDQEIGQDVQKVFQQITGMGKTIKLKKLCHAPFTLFDTLMDLIEFEITQAKANKPARIIAKMNSLTERKIIRALYRASQAGVKIDLIVRGICCLRPGIRGVSDNIKVRSIVGRFLEHPRIYYFSHAGDEQLYCSSADWMERNFYKRVELAFPILNKSYLKQIKENSLLLPLKDNVQSWELRTDGTYRYLKRGNAARFCIQEELLAKFTQQ